MQKKAYPVSHHRHCHYHCQLLLHQIHGLLKIISKYDLINPYKRCTFTTLCTLGINSESWFLLLESFKMRFDVVLWHKTDFHISKWFPIFITTFVEILQLRAKFQTAMVSCSKFIWITVTTGGFELRISCIRSSYLTH